MTFLRTGTWPGRPNQGSPYFDGLGVTQSIAAEPGCVRDGDVPDADAVIATWWETAFSVAALSPAKGEKFYFIQHHEVHEHLPSHISRGSYYLPLRKITISQWLVDLMAEEYGDHDVGLVENSVDTDQFHAPPRDKGAPPTGGTALRGERLQGRRRQPQGDRGREARRSPTCTSRPSARTRSTRPCRCRRARTYLQRPSQDSIREIYGACDVWLGRQPQRGVRSATRSRRWPAARRWWRRGPGPRRMLINDGVDGWVVDVEDPEALGARLAEVARLSPEAWRAMSDAAHARAHSYSWDDATDRFEALLAAPRGRRPGLARDEIEDLAAHRRAV